MADEYKSLTHSAQSIDNTITGLGTHVADTTIHVTAQNKTDWNNKQSALTTEQLAAVNSGITAAKLTEDEAALTDLIDSGTKNLAVPFMTSSIDGIAITVSDDGAYTFECTNVSENKIIRVADIINQPSGEYVLSGCTGGSSTTFMLGLYNTSASAVVYQHTDPSVSYTGNISGFSIRVRIIAGYTGTFTVRPIICSAVEWKISESYMPYQAGLVDIYQNTTKLSPASDHGYDLDNLPTGRFQVESSTYAARIDNSPTAGTGYDVICKYLGSSAYKVQIAYCNTAADSFLTIFIRHYRGTGSGSVFGWSPWERFKSVGGSLTLSAATALAPNDGETVDLNTIITPDLYRVSLSTYASRITNSPITDFAYNLAVAQIGGTGYIRQEIIPANAPADIYVRYYNGTIWSSWVKMLSQNDAVMVEQVDNGAKNLFQITGTTSASIVTVNADQTVTVSGTPSSGNISFTMGKFTGEVGKLYHLSGCPPSGSDNTWRIAISDVGYDYGTGLDFVGDGSEHTVTLFVRQSSSSINITAKPMICTKAEWDVSNTYVPYAPTNKQLYDSKVDKARPSISSNSNLNDYKQVGHFKVTSSTTAATITNTPFTTAGYILDVDYWYQTLSGATGCIQTALTNAANTLIEKKRIYQYQDGEWSWTSWVTIYSIAVPT